MVRGWWDNVGAVLMGRNTFGGGIEAALERASEAAGGKDVWLTGGPRVIQQYLHAGLLDEIEISLAPVLLGQAERPSVTHIRYRVSGEDRAPGSRWTHAGS